MRHGDGGFTLVEVLIAVTILAVGILGVAGLAGTAIRSSGYTQALTQATNLAQERIEALQSVPFNNVEATDAVTTSPFDLRRTCTGPTGPVNLPVYTCTPTVAAVTVGNKTFTWAYTVTYIDLNGDGTASPATDGLKRVDVTISWTDPLWHTTKSLTVPTLFAR